MAVKFRAGQKLVSAVDTTAVIALTEPQMLALMRRWIVEERPNISAEALDQVDVIFRPLLSKPSGQAGVGLVGNGPALFVVSPACGISARRYRPVQPRNASGPLLHPRARGGNRRGRSI